MQEKIFPAYYFYLITFCLFQPKYFILSFVIPFIYKTYSHIHLACLVNLYSTLTILLFGYSPSSANTILYIRKFNPIFYALINIVFALISFFFLSSRGVLFLSFLSLSLFFLSRLNFYPIKNIFPANSWLIRLFWALFLSLLVALPTPLLALYSNQNLSPKEQDISLYERSIFAGVSLVSAKVIAIRSTQIIAGLKNIAVIPKPKALSFVGFLLTTWLLISHIFSLLFRLWLYLSMNVSVPLSPAFLSVNLPPELISL